MSNPTNEQITLGKINQERSVLERQVRKEIMHFLAETGLPPGSVKICWGPITVAQAGMPIPNRSPTDQDYDVMLSVVLP